jgi:hypothetical protein
MCHILLMSHIPFVVIWVYFVELMSSFGVNLCENRTANLQHCLQGHHLRGGLAMAAEQLRMSLLPELT